MTRLKASIWWTLGATVLGAAFVAWTSVLAQSGPQGIDELRQRVAALEAGQRTMLKEIQELKTMLQTRPAPAAPQAAAPPAGAPAAPQPLNVELSIDGSASMGRTD